MDKEKEQRKKRIEDIIKWLEVREIDKWRMFVRPGSYTSLVYICPSERKDRRFVTLGGSFNKITWFDPFARQYDESFIHIGKTDDIDPVKNNFSDIYLASSDMGGCEAFVERDSDGKIGSFIKSKLLSITNYIDKEFFHTF